MPFGFVWAAVVIVRVAKKSLEVHISLVLSSGQNCGEFDIGRLIVELLGEFQCERLRGQASLPD